jgi:hypothetical protein
MTTRSGQSPLITTGIAFTLSAVFVACGASGAADCESTEVFVVSGSDIEGEDNVEECRALPSECVDTPTCDCLQSAAFDGINWEFCVTVGSCEETPDGLEVSCPGG